MFTVGTLKNIYEKFVTASTGNHAQACAMAFKKWWKNKLKKMFVLQVIFLVSIIINKTFEKSGIIFLPKSVDKSKLKKIQKLDIDLSFVDGDPVEV